jgi:hypothetical protein
MQNDSRDERCETNPLVLERFVWRMFIRTSLVKTLSESFFPSLGFVAAQILLGATDGVIKQRGSFCNRFQIPQHNPQTVVFLHYVAIP